jgi:hypothetical protein
MCHFNIFEFGHNFTMAVTHTHTHIYVCVCVCNIKCQALTAEQGKVVTFSEVATLPCVLHENIEDGKQRRLLHAAEETHD